MDNTIIGNKTEKSASSILRKKKGYWVYNCPKSSTGAQPVDLIAIKGVKGTRLCKALFCDSKHVRTNEVSFPLSRIEPNQWSSLQFLNDFAQVHADNLGFIIEFERTGDYYWLPYIKAVEMAENGEKSINLNKLRLLEDMLNDYDNQ